MTECGLYMGRSKETYPKVITGDQDSRASDKISYHLYEPGLKKSSTNWKYPQFPMIKKAQGLNILAR
jgi:hypothetical protein